MNPFSWGKRGDGKVRTGDSRTEPRVYADDAKADDPANGFGENSDQNESMNTDNTSNDKPADDLDAQNAGQEPDANGAEDIIELVDAADDESAPVEDGDLEARVRELDGELLLARADAQNIQRRAKEELARANRYGAKRLATKMLDVRDSLERGLQVDIREATPEALEQMREGMELTLKQFDSAMDANSVVIINPEPGDKLDPSLHQAMGMTPSDDIDPNHIVLVVQKGYQLHDQLLRPAMVMVAAASAAAEAPGADESTDSDAPDEQDTAPDTDET